MIGPEHTSALAKFDFENKSQQELSKEEAYKLFKQDIRVGTFCILLSLVGFHLFEILSILWILTGYVGLFFIGHSAITQIKYNPIPNRIGFVFLALIGIVMILPTVNNYFYFFFIFLGLIPVFTLIGFFILVSPPINQRKKLKSN